MAQNNQIFKDGDILYAEDLNKIKSSLDDKAAVYIQNSAPLEAEDGDIWYYKDDELKTSKIYIRENNVWNEINTVPTYDEKNYGQVLSPSPSGLTWSKKNDLPLEKSNDSSIRHSSSVPSSDTLEGYHLGKNAFSLGKNSKSTGDGSFSLGENSTTTGPNSVAEGLNTEVSGIASHAEGQGTKASGNAQHVEGKYNIEDSTKAHIVGNGESDAKRSNIHTLDWKGKAWFSDDVLIGGTKSEDAPISLKKIAQNGGGGGGGTSDWNQNDPYGNGYIRNRPFYEEKVTEKQIIIPQDTYDFVDSYETNKIFMNRNISKACFIQKGDDITVFYDGTEYSNVNSIVVKRQLVFPEDLTENIPNIYLDFLCYGNSKAFFENYSADEYTKEPFFDVNEGLKTNHPFFIIIPINVEMDEIENLNPLVQQEISFFFSYYRFFGLCAPVGSPGTHTIIISTQKIINKIHYLDEKFTYNSDWDAKIDNCGFIKNKPCERKLIKTNSKLIVPDQTPNITTFLPGEVIALFLNSELKTPVKIDIPFTISIARITSSLFPLTIDKNQEQIYDLIIKTPSKNQLIVKKFENLPITEIPYAVLSPEFFADPAGRLMKYPIIGNISSLLKFMKNFYNTTIDDYTPEMKSLMPDWNLLVDRTIDSLNASCEQLVGAIVIPGTSYEPGMICGFLDDDPIYFALNSIEGIDEPGQNYMSFNIIEHTNDYTYKKINKKYIGTPDWDCFDRNSNNFIENKPFYKEPTEESEEKILIPQMTINNFQEMSIPGSQQELAYISANDASIALEIDIPEDMTHLLAKIDNDSYDLINIRQDRKKVYNTTATIIAAGHTKFLAPLLDDFFGEVNLNAEDYALEDLNQQSFGVIIIKLDTDEIDPETNHRLTATLINIYTTLPGDSHNVTIGTLGLHYVYHPIPPEYLDLTKISAEVSKTLDFPGRKDLTEPTGEIFNDYKNNQSSGLYSHAQGFNTQALSKYQSVSGKYNVGDDLNKYSHIIGNGNSSQHSNSLTLNWDGTLWCANDIKIGGQNVGDPLCISLKNLSQSKKGNFSIVEKLPEKTEDNYKEQNLYLNTNKLCYYSFDTSKILNNDKQIFTQPVFPIFSYYLNDKIYILVNHEFNMVIYDCKKDAYTVCSSEESFPVDENGCAVYYYNKNDSSSHILYFSSEVAHPTVYDWNLNTFNFSVTSKICDSIHGIRKETIVQNNDSNLLIIGGEITNGYSSTTWTKNLTIFEYNYETNSAQYLFDTYDYQVGNNAKSFNYNNSVYYLCQNYLYKIENNNFKMHPDTFFSDQFAIDYDKDILWFIDGKELIGYRLSDLNELKPKTIILTIDLSVIPDFDDLDPNKILLIGPDHQFYLLYSKTTNKNFGIKFLSYPIKNNIISNAGNLICGNIEDTVTNSLTNVFSKNGTHSIAYGEENTINAPYALAQGLRCSVGKEHTNGEYLSGEYSHAEGRNTDAYGNYCHTEGYRTETYGVGNHCEGTETEAGTLSFPVSYCHTEGFKTKAKENYSHTEGAYTEAYGQYSHAEGRATKTNGTGAHAEGYCAIADGNYSHAEGNNTIAKKDYQKVIGSYNTPDTISSVIVGNGLSEKQRSNSFTLNDKGIGWFSKDIYLGGLSSEDSKAISILDYLSKLDAQITYNSMKNKTLLPIEKDELITKLSKWYSLGIWTKEMVQEAINLEYITNEDSQIIYAELTPKEHLESESISTSNSESTPTSML